MGQCEELSADGAGRSPAVEIITTGLQQAEAQADPGKRRASLEELARTVTAAADNVLVSDRLERAAERAQKLPDDEAVRELRDSLQAARAVLRFRPIREAPLPEGYPEPPPVGQIVVKHYPACRLARTPVTDQIRQGDAFMTLFRHIQKNDIAMTAPVEMTFRSQTREKLREVEMAFLYRSPTQGQAGKEERVEVVDVPAADYISLGLTGDFRGEQVAEAPRAPRSLAGETCRAVRTGRRSAACWDTTAHSCPRCCGISRLNSRSANSKRPNEASTAAVVRRHPPEAALACRCSSEHSAAFT